MKLKHVAPWKKKNYDHPRQHIKKQRDYFSNKGPSSQSYGFSSSHVWIESWTITKTEYQWIDDFELWCWRRLLPVLWTSRRSSQSVLTSPEYSFEALMLKLKLQYFGHLMWRTDTLEKTLMMEKIEAGEEGERRGWYGWVTSPLDGHEFEYTLGVGDEQGRLACFSPWDPQSQTWLSDWTELNSFQREFSLVCLPEQSCIYSLVPQW